MKIQATVVKGLQIGATFGAATANLQLNELPKIEEGVHLVTVQISEDKTIYNGLLHFGHRKTFGGDFSAEVHILDFKQNIYGKKLSLSLVQKLREVKAFKNADALFTQIEMDVLKARKYFLRCKIKACWKSLSINDQQQLAANAIKHLNANVAFLEADTIFVYAPQLGQEISFIAKLMTDFSQKKYAFPAVKDQTIQFYLVKNYTDLKPGKFNILTPTKRQMLIPKAKDLMLVPSVSMSLSGSRLGQGGGFYDRYLAIHKVKTLAVVPSFALSEKIPQESHDKTIDQVIVCDL